MAVTLPGKLIKKEEPPKSKKQVLLEKIQATLKEYGKESDIPFTHDYWDWKNKYRA